MHNSLTLPLFSEVGDYLTPLPGAIYNRRINSEPKLQTRRGNDT